MTGRKNFVAAAVLLAGLVAPTWAASWGDLTGKLVLDGAAPARVKLSITKDQEVCGKMDLFDEGLEVGDGGGIANIAIYVITKEVDVHPDYAATAEAEVVLDNKGCRFEPHLLGIRLSQKLKLTNSDPIGHNVNLQPLGDVAINPLIPGGGDSGYQFKRAQTRPVPVSCNIHPWMKGYVLPRDNPYFAVTAADGTFTIKNLPAGKIEFQVWHELPGYVDTATWKKGKFEMEIKPGANDLGTVKLAAKLFQKK